MPDALLCPSGMAGGALSPDGCGSMSALQRRCRILQEQNAELRLAGLWRSRSGQVVAIEFGQVSGKYPIFDIDPELRQFSVAYGTQRFRGSFNACFETLWWEDGDVWRRFPLADAAHRGLSDSVVAHVAVPACVAVPQPQIPQPRQTTPGTARAVDSCAPAPPQQPQNVATTSSVSDSPQSPKVATKAPPPPAATPPKSASSRVVAAPPAQPPAESAPKSDRGFSRASTTALGRSSEAPAEESANGAQAASARPAAGSKGGKPSGPPPSGPPAAPSGAPKAGKGAPGAGKGPPATPGRGPKPKGKGGGKRAGSFARGGMSFGTGGGSRDARPTFS
mmetsp:Transcript_63029/g.168924  ORF Transcript_63029/g.168924 Transcript_63029/m.168924 type:complete len:335 (-) Transcript_63029:210-1214(-)